MVESSKFRDFAEFACAGRHLQGSVCQLIDRKNSRAEISTHRAYASVAGVPHLLPALSLGESQFPPISITHRTMPLDGNTTYCTNVHIEPEHFIVNALTVALMHELEAPLLYHCHRIISLLQNDSGDLRRGTVLSMTG